MYYIVGSTNFSRSNLNLARAMPRVQQYSCGMCVIVKPYCTVRIRDLVPLYPDTKDKVDFAGT